MINESFIKRLAFVRHIYTIAVEQSYRPEPMNAASLLTFHDSVEFFMHLACEHCDVKPPSDFLSYWDVLKSKCLEGFPTQRETMRRLNKSRVALKHHGTLPSKLDVEDFRSIVKAFFTENTTSIFAHDFTSLSLTYLVDNDDVRQHLASAEQLINDNKLQDALDAIAVAFEHLIYVFESSYYDKYHRSPFRFTDRLPNPRDFFPNERYPKTEPFDKLIELIGSLQTEMKILSLGLDYRRYIKYKTVTPIVHRAIFTGNYHVVPSSQTPSKSDCEFCFNFVVESAIHIQSLNITAEYGA